MAVPLQAQQRLGLLVFACAHARSARQALELNPNMLADGTFRKTDESAPAKALLDVPVGGAVGDGGASWRMKALRRAQERAAEEGRTMDAVVQERWVRGCACMLFVSQREGLTCAVVLLRRARSRTSAPL